MAGLTETGKPDWRIVPQGDRTLLLVFGEQIDIETGRRCARAAAALRAANIPGVSDIVPSFNQLALHYQPGLPDTIDRHTQLISAIQKPLLAALADPAQADTSRQIKIPVCYGGEHGPDLEHVAEHCGLTPEQVIHLHSHQPAYVFMLGFAPGAPYIGVHDTRLAIGRRATPRTLLPAGSVAIANLQTMIYPNASPGGWHVIGATPAVLFDPEQEPPTLLAPGDTVSFVPISPTEFQALKDKQT
ncbi:5-oxoprolinase subunit PxpB [Pollutimonas harenae]|uniref:5-oxoprolinase subunit PxpB n=1 Tax=Pollutimonas harenae TaxID=657015 RepID=A0A853GWR8_9BURK|nr:5-oxoprolinase subunit PxpB [Pollutimonas harenae]NYT84210.1 5-oxoprolinase subunit PxpB [Pollutimonas harenae]TEA73375.1 5-oxoprolinase subunit PxpB [Pollutimonas harenae]